MHGLARSVVSPLRHNASLLSPTTTQQRLSAILKSATSANRSSAIAHVFEEQERAFLAQVPTLRREWRAYWSLQTNSVQSATIYAP